MTKCNFCKLNQIKRFARNRSMAVFLFSDRDTGLLKVYVAPKKVKQYELRADSFLRNKYYKDSFKSLPGNCKC